MPLVPDPATGSATTARQATEPRPGTIRQGDRDKALRPLPLETRRAAFEHALEAYGGGDFFEAHELLEPAWMGTADLEERALHQGLIKIAAAYVHAVRGNPAGITRNLQGARGHLANAGAAAGAWGVDVATLLDDIDARLADASAATLPPPVIRRTSVP
jgi:predicted metal-dependent hydrolase